MSRRKQLLAIDQVSEFDKGRIVDLETPWREDAMHRHTGPAPGIMIELLPWPARSPDLLPIENICSMVAQRLTQITLPAATPYQLWQRVEAAWSAVPQEHIQSLFESMQIHVAALISHNGGYSGY
ncbi:transposable element Tcb1 transposase [Trichonephila clavipes]|nr:transposable element Tcb1 transposase [Trichonephila clavipes]